MRTLATFGQLVSDAGRMWLTAFPTLGMWFCLGFVLDRGLFQAAMTVGGRQAYLALVLFILGVLASVAATVIMIGSLEPQLSRLALLRQRAGHDPNLPESATLTAETGRGATLALALGPFLAVYALWGLVDDRVREMIVANQVRYNLDVDAWAIDLRRWQGYLLLALVAWLIKVSAGALHRRFGRHGLAVLAVLADGIFVFASFLGLYRGGIRVIDWFTERAVWGWITGAWRAFQDTLPDLSLPFDLTLPEALDQAVRWFTGTGLPALAEYLMLPLVWLALTAVVFGWRTVHELTPGSRLGRLTNRLTRSWEPLGRVVSLSTVDVREKYLPVWHALRLIRAAGPRFIGCYLLAATLLAWLRGGFEVLLTTLIGPVPAEQMLFLGPSTELLTGLLFNTLAVALYAAAFDRTLLTARRAQQSSGWRRQPGSRTSTRVPLSRPS